MSLPSRAVVLLVALATPLISGCIMGDEEQHTTTFPLEVYEYRYAGDDVLVPGHPYGFLARIHNPTDQEVQIVVEQRGMVDRWGPVHVEGWASAYNDETLPLRAGDSHLYLFQITEATAVDVRSGFSVMARFAGTVSGVSQAFERNLTTASDVVPVGPGDHVQTATVGLWANGTSFYSNIADLNADESFPAGYDRSTFDGAPLPVYVYDTNNDEQPDRSVDTCHFTTIAGYNALLKTQAAESTNVRFLQPDEAYTRPDREDHELYGDALIFMNTIVAHDGPTGPVDQLPDPTGACFDPERYSPVEPPPLV